MHWANEIGDRKRLVNTEVYSLFKRFTLCSSPLSERDISQWDYGPFISHESVGVQLILPRRRLLLLFDWTRTCDFYYELQAGLFDWSVRVEENQQSSATRPGFFIEMLTLLVPSHSHAMHGGTELSGVARNCHSVFCPTQFNQAERIGRPS